MKVHTSVNTYISSLERCGFMVDRIVKEINICLENDCYISALGMALTLPDICGKAKYPQWKKLRYKKWYDEYIGFREIPS